MRKDQNDHARARIESIWNSIPMVHGRVRARSRRTGAETDALGAHKREEELAERVEMWPDKMRRLKAHGDEHKLAPVFKINGLRMLMAGKAMEYFDL